MRTPFTYKNSVILHSNGFFVCFFRSDPLTAVRECEDELLLIHVAIEAEPFKKYSIFLSASEIEKGGRVLLQCCIRMPLGRGNARDTERVKR